MSFKALEIAYGSSESENDEEPATSHAADLGSAGKRTENTNGNTSGHRNETDPVHEDQITQSTIQSGSPRNARSTTMPPLPPPPTALLQTGDHAFGLVKRMTRLEAVSQATSKKRKVENCRNGLFLPRQVQTQIPNLSTEDLQSYGMTFYLNKEPQ